MRQLKIFVFFFSLSKVPKHIPPTVNAANKTDGAIIVSTPSCANIMNIVVMKSQCMPAMTIYSQKAAIKAVQRIVANPPKFPNVIKL